MYHFIQERADKNCRWRMVPADRHLEDQPAFKTVLAVSSDPAQILEQGSNPDDKVRYRGPLYFDLDGSDISEVIKDAQSLVKQLREAHMIPSNAIKIFLSGKKGFHVLISEKALGIPSKGKLYLPLIYKEFAMKFNLESLDEVVYSLGKGRMWRCTGVQRPDNGKYKVQITEEELALLTQETYDFLCSTPRPEFAQNGEVEEIPELKSFVEATFELVKKQLKDREKQENSFTLQDIAVIEGVPGCIEKLVTEGDCPDSNWNVAAMSLASYIAAKYEDKNASEASDLVNRFVVNVESGSRPTESARRQAMTDLLGRAYTGSLKFFVGTLIKALGKPCGNCALCSREQKISDEVSESLKGVGFDAMSGIKTTEFATFKVGETSNKLIANFRLVPLTVYCELDKFGQEQFKETDYMAYSDITPQGYFVTIPENDLLDRRILNQIVNTAGVFAGSESDNISLSMMLRKLKSECDKVIRTPIAGIIFFKRDGEIFPQLVTKDEAYSRGGLVSPFQYIGNSRFAPSIGNVPSFDDATKNRLKSTIEALFEMNEDRVMIPAIGWTMACHLKTHLTHRDKGFPMLSMSGTSHTGKSSTAHILMTLNAFAYRQAPVWNAETDTIYPLEDMVTSSRTVIRIVEEANEHVAKRNWQKLLGLLKSSWDEGGISKGTVKGRNVVTEIRDNTAPIMYLSEQAFPVQSIRTRSVEVSFQTKTVSDPYRSKCHSKVVDNIQLLEMIAKVAMLRALDTTDFDIQNYRNVFDSKIPVGYMGRLRTSVLTVLIGLEFLAKVLDELCTQTSEMVREYIERYLVIIEEDVDRSTRASSVSALDELIMDLDRMAGEFDNPAHGLISGTHYYKEGGLIYLDLRSIVPRYLRYVRGLGVTPSVRTAVQLERLIEGEAYFMGMTPHPEAPSLQLVTIDEEALRSRDVGLNEFRSKKLG